MKCIGNKIIVVFVCIEFEVMRYMSTAQQQSSHTYIQRKIVTRIIHVLLFLLDKASNKTVRECENNSYASFSWWLPLLIARKSPRITNTRWFCGCYFLLFFSMRILAYVICVCQTIPFWTWIATKYVLDSFRMRPVIQNTPQYSAKQSNSFYRLSFSYFTFSEIHQHTHKGTHVLCECMRNMHRKKILYSLMLLCDDSCTACELMNSSKRSSKYFSIFFTVSVGILSISRRFRIFDRILLVSEFILWLGF